MPNIPLLAVGSENAGFLLHLNEPIGHGGLAGIERAGELPNSMHVGPSVVPEDRFEHEFRHHELRGELVRGLLS